MSGLTTSLVLASHGCDCSSAEKSVSAFTCATWIGRGCPSRRANAAFSRRFASYSRTFLRAIAEVGQCKWVCNKLTQPWARRWLRVSVFVLTAH
eukprot:349961-Chlamydomonas_euryale.AAC.4